MFQLMDRVRGGVDPMIANLESYIVTTGLDDMKASADTITSVSSLIYKYWAIFDIIGNSNFAFRRWGNKTKKLIFHP